MGASRYASEFDVWLDKIGEAPPREDNERMWWGRALEPVVAQRYEIETGRKLWNPEQIYRDPKDDILIGTPDRIVVGESRGIDIKTTGQDQSHHWGDPGTDDIPQEYVVQCCHYMMVTGFPVWDVAVLVGGNDFRIYTIRRDVELEAMMRPRLVEWWQRHIVERIEPKASGSRSVRDWLMRRFPRESGPVLKASPEANALASRLAAAREAQEIAEGQRAEIENALRAMIAEAAGIEGDGWRISYKATKPREVRDWSKFIAAMIEEVAAIVGAVPGRESTEENQKTATALVNAILDKCTVEQPGGRRFVFTERGR